MTSLERRVSAAIVAWCATNGLLLRGRPRHIYPRCYVVGRVGLSGPLVVAQPGVDAELHLRAWTLSVPEGLVLVSRYDRSLKAGGWCSCAYICREGSQETVAIPVVE